MIHPELRPPSKAQLEPFYLPQNRGLVRDWLRFLGIPNTSSWFTFSAPSWQGRKPCIEPPSRRGRSRSRRGVGSAVPATCFSSRSARICAAEHPPETGQFGCCNQLQIVDKLSCCTEAASGCQPPVTAVCHLFEITHDSP